MSIACRNTSQSIQDVIKMILSTNSQVGAVSKENHELEVDYLQVQMLNQTDINPTVEDEPPSNTDEGPICLSKFDEESIHSSNDDEDCLSNDKDSIDLSDDDEDSICLSDDDDLICLSNDDDDSNCLLDTNRELFSTYFDNGEVKTSSFYDDISIEEEDICVSC